MDTSIREVTSEATIHEKKKLRKGFRLFDMIFFTVNAIIVIDALGAVSSQGGQALTWIFISAITFLIPYGLLTAELGTTFSQEGGVYEWCKLAGGRFFASLAAMLYWVSNPLWIGGTLTVTAIIAIKTLWFGNPNILFGGSVVTDAIIKMLIALVFIWGTAWSAIILLTVVFYIWGHLEKRNKDVVIELNFKEEGTSETVLNETVVDQRLRASR